MAARATPIEKVSQREPTDLLYYRTTEPTAVIDNVVKRDSPLDLSVKTIRQSADSTAHDDPDNSVYGQPFAHASGRLPHLAQLPYPQVAGLPAVRNHSPGNSFNTSQSRQTQQFSMSTSVSVPYPEGPPYVLNGQLHKDRNRHPVSEYRNEKMTVSITYEQEKQVHRTTQVSSMQYAQYYHHPSDGNPKSARPPPLAATPDRVNPNPMISPDVNHGAVPVASKAVPNVLPRKRKPTNDVSSSPLKNPRISSEWRENIDKVIENRLNAYTTMKAKEEEERQQLKVKNDSYRDPSPHRNLLSKDLELRRSSTSSTPPQQQQQQHPQLPPVAKTNSSYAAQPTHSPKLPFGQYAEQSPKAQHKLPVQPVQSLHPHQQWYHNNAHLQPRGGAPTLANSPYKQPVFTDHTLQFSRLPYDSRVDLKPIEKIENPKLADVPEHQKPLPSFGVLPTLSFPNQSKSPAVGEPFVGRHTVEVKTERNTPDVELSSISPLPRKERSENQSREALMASALAHPRIRTKAELKQVSVI